MSSTFSLHMVSLLFSSGFSANSIKAHLELLFAFRWRVLRKSSRWLYLSWASRMNSSVDESAIPEGRNEVIRPPAH